MQTLNIKDPQAHRLARAIAAQTGETMTRAVIAALEERAERLERQRKKPSLEELMAIARSAAAELKGESIDIDEFLYDERGLPKED